MLYCTAILKDKFLNAQKWLIYIKENIIPSGNIFVILRSEYDINFNVQNDFFDMIEYGEKAGLYYINTIVVPTKVIIENELPDNIMFIVWFAKDKKKQVFHKDLIREKHIWKDVEWGKREKNYNPKGKDPGNVWIPTKDNGMGKITEHVLMPTSDIIKRLFLCGHQDGFKSILLSNESSDVDSCNENMQFVLLEQNINNPTYLKKTEYRKLNGRSLQNDQLLGRIIWRSSECMCEIKNNTIDLVVTSPPYWDLKDYYKKGQIGQEEYHIYLDRLYKVWNECYNKLTFEGSMWININIRVKNNKTILLPKDIITQCKKIGFFYKGIVIWHKSSGIPTREKNIVDRHEYIVVFSKSLYLSINDQIKSFSDYKNSDINGCSFWNINRKAGSVGKQLHPAIFPNELVARIVLSCTSKNQTVLDPFLGSGTTLIAAVLSGRNCYGYEYNEGFKSLILNRINSEIGFTSNVKIISTSNIF